MLALLITLIFVALYIDWLPLALAVLSFSIYSARHDARWYWLIVQALIGFILGALMRGLRPSASSTTTNTRNASRIYFTMNFSLERMLDCVVASIIAFVYALLYRRLTFHVVLDDPWVSADIGRITCIVATAAILCFAHLIKRSWLTNVPNSALVQEHAIALSVAAFVVLLDLLAWPSGGAGRAAVAVSIAIIVGLIAMTKIVSLYRK